MGVHRGRNVGPEEEAAFQRHDGVWGAHSATSGRAKNARHTRKQGSFQRRLRRPRIPCHCHVWTSTATLCSLGGEHSKTTTGNPFIFGAPPGLSARPCVASRTEAKRRPAINPDCARRWDSGGPGMDTGWIPGQPEMPMTTIGGVCPPSTGRRSHDSAIWAPPSPTCRQCPPTAEFLDHAASAQLPGRLPCSRAAAAALKVLKCT